MRHNLDNTSAMPFLATAEEGEKGVVEMTPTQCLLAKVVERPS